MILFFSVYFLSSAAAPARAPPDPSSSPGLGTPCWAAWSLKTAGCPFRSWERTRPCSSSLMVRCHTMQYLCKSDFIKHLMMWFSLSLQTWDHYWAAKHLLSYNNIFSDSDHYFQQQVLQLSSTYGWSFVPTLQDLKTRKSAFIRGRS